MTSPHRALAALLIVVASATTLTGAGYVHASSHPKLSRVILSEGPPTCCGQGGQD